MHTKGTGKGAGFSNPQSPISNPCVHVSEPKWGDDPYEEDLFEERQQKDLATMVMMVLLVVAAVFLVLLWWAVVSTVEPGPLAFLAAFLGPGIH